MLIPMILSGGSGTRLWPVSREAYPKPFIKLQDGRSLLQKTVDRLADIEGISDVLTVTNQDHFFITRDDYQGAQLSAHHFFVLEPCARNSARGAMSICASRTNSSTTANTARPTSIRNHHVAQ